MARWRVTAAIVVAVSSCHHVRKLNIWGGVVACGPFVVKISDERLMKCRCPMLPRRGYIQKRPDRF